MRKLPVKRLQAPGQPPYKLCVQEMRSKNITQKIRVWLDGVEQINRVTSYNTKEGWLKRYKQDEAGRPYIEQGNLVVEKCIGTVKVEWG